MREAAPAAGLSRWNDLLSTWRDSDVPDGRRAEIVDDSGVVLVAPHPIPMTTSRPG